MSESDRQQLLRIKNAICNENGLLIQFEPMHGCILLHESRHHINTNNRFCSSNYVLSTPSHKRAIDFNFALKLMQPSCSSLYIGYQQQPSAEHYINPPGYFGLSALQITPNDIPKLTSLVEKSKARASNSKLAIMAEKYLYATSNFPGNESRYIEMSIILEMLLLPTQSSELAYRFSLRLAKLLNIFSNRELKNSFELGKEIYKARSKLVHSGKYSKLEEIATQSYEVTCILLREYLENPMRFSDDTLDELCLGV